MLKKGLWIGAKKRGRQAGKEGGRQKLAKLYLQPLLHKSPTTKQQSTDISTQHSKKAIRQGKLREITKCLLTRFS